MKKIAVVDRFEENIVVLETDDEEIIEIPAANAPKMLGEGMVVELDGDVILRIDHEETARREDEMRRRFERLLGKKD